MQKKRPACRQAGFAHFLLVLVAATVVLSGGYFYQRTKSDTLEKPNSSVVIQSIKQPDYQEYSNSELGFGFKYSKELNLKLDSEEEFDQRAAGSASKRGNGDFRKNFKDYVGYEPGKILGAAVVLDSSDSYDTNPFSIWVFNNENNLTIEQWFQNYWYYPYLWGVFDYTSKSHVALDHEATVSGKLAKTKIVSYQKGPPKYVYISNNGKIYLFRVMGDKGDKILSEFKFLE